MYDPAENTVIQLGRDDLKRMTPEQIYEADQAGQFSDLKLGKDPNVVNSCPHCGGSLDTPPPPAAA